MTYKEWAGEYYASAAKIKKQLAGLREEMKNAVGESLQLLESRRIILHSMYKDCIYVADMLAVRKGEV